MKEFSLLLFFLISRQKSWAGKKLQFPSNLSVRWRGSNLRWTCKAATILHGCLSWLHSVINSSFPILFPDLDCQKVPGSMLIRLICNYFSVPAISARATATASLAIFHFQRRFFAIFLKVIFSRIRLFITDNS